MDDLQLHMEIAQRNHDEASRLFNEFMQTAEQNHQHQHEVSDDVEMAKLEQEFQEWMEYIHNKKLD